MLFRKRGFIFRKTQLQTGSTEIKCRDKDAEKKGGMTGPKSDHAAVFFYSGIILPLNQGLSSTAYRAHPCTGMPEIIIFSILISLRLDGI